MRLFPGLAVGGMIGLRFCCKRLEFTEAKQDIRRTKRLRLDVLVVASDFRRNLSVKWYERRHRQDDTRSAVQVRYSRTWLHIAVGLHFADKAEAEVHILRPLWRFFLPNPDRNLPRGKIRVEAPANEPEASDRHTGVTFKKCPLA